jgi:hypothetical protein
MVDSLRFTFSRESEARAILRISDGGVTISRLREIVLLLLGIGLAGCYALGGPMDALVLVTGTAPMGATKCRVHVWKTTLDFGWRDVEEKFRLDYVANPGDKWFDVEIYCGATSIFKKQFVGPPSRIDVGPL